MDRKQLRRTCVDILERFLRTLFFWTRDDKEFINMVIILHFSLGVIYSFLFFYSCLFDLSLYILVPVLVIVILIIIQHWILGICLLGSIEKRLTGKPYPFIDPLLHVFGIPITEDTQIGVTSLLLSASVVILLLHALRFQLKS